MHPSHRRSPAEPVPVRRLRLDHVPGLARWHPVMPEFAAACNALSLGMPHGEPYVMNAVRRCLPDLDDPALVARAEAYLGQEGAHSARHRRFNDVLVAGQPSLARVERWLAVTYRWLGRRSRAFNIAFAAGFEAMAFASARWLDENRHELFSGADPAAATLFLWHLAEEAEHKSDAFDVWSAFDGSRLRYAWAMTVSFVVLAWFILVGTVVQLAHTRRLLHPLAWIRLTRWVISYVFEVLPTMVATVLPGHHPSDLVDPAWMPRWLETYDAATETIPVPAFLQPTPAAGSIPAESHAF